MARAARAAFGAVEKMAAGEGTRVDSLIVEFVDDGGSVVQTERFGGLNQAKMAKGNEAGMEMPGRAAGSESRPAPAPQAQGHTPIGGLKPTPQGGAETLPGVKHIIAVGAGKGGVGKSTVALNLAVGLARRGLAVGLLDGDIYGPSMPTMLGLESLETVVHEGQLQPFVTHGIKCMTIGKLVAPDKPLIWRGPMAHGAFKQLTEQTRWGELDYLIIDLPPGTGDVSLSMAQMLKVTGAVVVCTPQKVAQDDAWRAAKMFQQLGVPVLGVVENMSYFVGDDGKVYDIFGRGGAEHMAQKLGVPFLGAVPITMALRANSDKGDPTANYTGEDRAGTELREKLEGLVRNLEGQVALASMKLGQERPTLRVS
ncbi:MAG: P-loop NTPase [Tepidisphaera sp.]|nr:P-loop NTPase [Tepidisphaera sp.]